MDSMQAFPVITKEEFSEACKALEQRSADRINNTDWLSVKWTGEELRIRQQRKHDGKENDDRGVEVEGDELFEDEVQDLTVARTPRSDGPESRRLLVDFSIVLSPTYSVPVLWFSCRNDSNDRPLSLDQVYDLLVAGRSVESLRSIGVMGGISMAHHPVSDVPCFFLHPCMSQEALLALKPHKSPTPEAYLLLWIGLMGSAVSLYVPSKLLSA